MVADVVADMQASGEGVPDALAEKKLQRRVSRTHPAHASPATGADAGGARGKPESAGECRVGGLKFLD